YNQANLKFGAISKNNYGSAVFSPIYITYKVNDDFDPEYINLLVNRNEFIQRVLRYQEGTVYERMAVKSNDFLKIEVVVTSFREQQIVGRFFSNIDEIITKIQLKLNVYISIKNILLDNLFI